MRAALSKAGTRLTGKKEDDMTAGNADNACRHTTLPRAETLSAVPHILIAEEHPAIQDLLCWTLQLAGYRPTVCAGRQAAFTWRDQAMTPGDDPMVLLLDLSLLGVTDAADFLRHLRARWQDAGGMLPQVIVLTTSKQVQAELGMREHVLQKPFHVRELLALIQQAIAVASPGEGCSSRKAHAPDHQLSNVSEVQGDRQ
jgi:DNA-binding response OmpR family regulator